MSFMKKKDVERVELFNQVLGTHHRTKPFDWKKSEDIIEALTMAIAEFVDTVRMADQLSGMCDDFDEMIEHYHPHEWSKFAAQEEWENTEVEEAMHSLALAYETMKDLGASLHGKMQELLSLLFFAVPQDVRDHFFTRGWQFVPADVEAVIAKDLFEIVWQMDDYDGVIEHSAAKFTEELENLIKRRGQPVEQQPGPELDALPPF